MGSPIAPSCSSEIARFIVDFPIKSQIVISHIRQANVGDICLENTHPFIREYAGHYWCFAHNGQLKDYQQLTSERFKPVGATDSEHVFCWLMEQISQRCENPLNTDCVGKLLRDCRQQLHRHGVFNMLLSNSKIFIAY